PERGGVRGGAGTARRRRRRRRRQPDAGPVRRRLPGGRGAVRRGDSGQRQRPAQSRRRRRMAEPAIVSDGATRPALLILHVDAPGAADAVYRTVQPCRALGELPEIAVISGSILSPELYRAAPGGAPGVDLLSAADILV